MFVSNYKTETEVLWDIWGDVKKIWDILFNGIQYKLLCYTVEKTYSQNPYKTLKKRGIKKGNINTLKLNIEL